LAELARKPSLAVVAGISAVSKTTFIKSLWREIAAGMDFAVLDLADEYEGAGRRVKASIDLLSLTVDGLALWSLG